MKGNTTTDLFPNRLNTDCITQVDILIVGGTLLTMDKERRVVEDGAIAILGDRIVAVGKTSDIQSAYQAVTVINAHDKAVLPGLIDSHGHAGHGLVKTMGIDHPGSWKKPARKSIPGVQQKNSGGWTPN